MKTLKIDENGDISFDSLGKLNFAKDKELLIQSLNLRIKTEKGELFYNDTYGHPIFKGKLTEDNLLSFLNNTLLDDNRVSKVQILSFKLEKSAIKAEINITLNTNETLNLNLKF